MVLDITGFRALMESLTESRPLSEAELLDGFRVCLSVEHAVQAKLLNTYTGHRSRQPLVVAYMNDGWSTDIQTVEYVKVAGAPQMRVVGRQRSEFLLERSLIRTDAVGTDHELVIMLRPPRSLKWEKSAAHLFAAGASGCLQLRNRGFLGPLLLLILLDGNGCNPKQAKLLVGRHEGWYAQRVDLDEDARWGLQNSEFYLHIRCKLHSTNKAVEWGLDRLQASAIQEDTFVVISSVQKHQGRYISTFPSSVQQRSLTVPGRTPAMTISGNCGDAWTSNLLLRTPS